MTKSGLPQSVRKYIRLQKSLIRRGILDMAEQERRISKLYEDMVQKYQVKDTQLQKQVDKQDSIIPAAAEKVLPVKQ